MKNQEGGTPKIFFGWWTVLFSGIISGLGHGFYGFGISVFFKDIALELGLSRAITSLAAGIGRLEVPFGRGIFPSGHGNYLRPFNTRDNVFIYIPYYLRIQ